MTGYNKYVFDASRRTFLGRFDQMYAAEARESFDSWHQDDCRHLPARVAHAILDDYCFGRIVDVGCGKGTWAHVLRKQNNHLTGIDVSPIAVEIARSRYPDIDFIAGDVSLGFGRLVPEPVDLVTIMQILSYIENWPDLIQDVADRATHCLLGLYIPPDPIGFVESGARLRDVFAGSFDIIEDVTFASRNQHILFGRSRTAPNTGPADVR